MIGEILCTQLTYQLLAIKSYLMFKSQALGLQYKTKWLCHLKYAIKKAELYYIL